MRTLVKLFFFFSLCFAAPLVASYTVIHDQAIEKIKSPSMQNVKRLKIKLDNGLEAYIVSDPDARKSGAALSVGVGYNNEPFEHVGMAHFVEHMLFMGTKKYPVEKEYHDFIDSHGGRANAYTSGDRTVYFYEIDNNHMTEAMDRFSSFFVEPLFQESGLERESSAVDQEFQYRANIDGVRMMMVENSLLDERSHAHIWRCGNKESLKNITRAEMLNWYQANYSANIMKLAVYSSLPMEELVKNVDQDFSQIENKNVAIEPLKGPVSKTENLGKMIYVEPLKDLKQMEITWEMPSKYARDLDYHTADLVSYVLGDESPKSLATYLKDKGYIHSLHCGHGALSKEVCFFSIDLNLTQEGLDHKEQVIADCYEAIHTLSKNGIPRYRYDEMVALAKLKYQYQSRPDAIDYVGDVAAAILNEPIGTFPEKSLWPSKFDAIRVQDFLSQLEPNNAVYVVMAPGDYVGKAFDQEEPIAHVSFCVEETPSSLLNTWAQIPASKNFAVAAPNPYIPTSLSLVTSDNDYNAKGTPVVLEQNDKETIYYSADQDYQLPEAAYNVFLLSPSFQASARNSVYNDFYSWSLSQDLCQLTEQGALAGLSASTGVHPKYGLQVSVSGYSQKAQLFLDKILEQAKNFEPQAKDFERYKDLLLRSYQNQSKQSPFQQAGMIMRTLLFKDQPSIETKIAILNEMQFADFQAYCKQLFEKVYIRALMYGNINTKQAHQFVTKINTLFEQSEAYPVGEHFSRAILDFSQASTPRYYSESTDQVGNATMLLINHGHLNHRDRAACEIFAKAVAAPFFDTLRTKQQVGYIARSYPIEYDQNLFTSFLVQSNSCSTRDLLSRYELFNEEFLASLGTDEFNEAKFTTIKEALISEYQQPPVSIAEKGGELTTLAFEYQNFEWKKECITALEKLTFNEFKHFCMQNLGKYNHKRMAVFIDGEMSGTPMLNYVPIQNLNNFKAESDYVSTPPLKEMQIDQN